MATGHFGYTENTRDKNYEVPSSKGYRNNVGSSEVQVKVVSKGPTYEELRKFMWS